MESLIIISVAEIFTITLFMVLMAFIIETADI